MYHPIMNKMKFDIVCYTRLHNYATLAGLARDVKGFKGDLQFSIQEPAAVFWDKMSYWAIHCIYELCADRILIIDVSDDDSYDYICNGGISIMDSFKEQQIEWTPITFKLGRRIQFTPDQCKQIEWLMLHERFNKLGYWNYPIPVLELERMIIDKIIKMSRDWSPSSSRRSFSRYIEKIGLLNYQH